MSGIHRAIKDGDVDRVRAILEENPGAAEEPDDRGLLPIWSVVADSRDLDILRLLLRAAPHTVVAECVDGSGDTVIPVRNAIVNWNSRAVRAMVDIAGPSALRVDDYGDWALWVAIYAPTLQAHIPIGDDGWARVPDGLPGLLQALPAALGHQQELRSLVRKLGGPERQRLCHLLWCLGQLGLPQGPVAAILSNCF